MESIGRLFPAGGPVDADLVIGRHEFLEDVQHRLREGVHTLIAGPRRAGKTTVGKAACVALRDDFEIIEVEAPERSTAVDFCQLLMDRCARIGLAAAGRRLLRATRPLIEELLSEAGVPLDLSDLERPRQAGARRAVLELPCRIAERTGRPILVFVDEIQRVIEYDGGDELLLDLVDIYAGQTNVVLLVDGSNERTIDGLLGGDVNFGKLVSRQDLNPTIPPATFKEGLIDHYARADLRIEAGALNMVVEFGEGEPYPTMTAARYAALTARRTGADIVDLLCVEKGIAEARRHLRDDANR